jgi:hypothetical protein
MLSNSVEDMAAKLLQRRIVILNGTPGIKNHPRCYEKKKEMHVQEVRTR